MDLNMAQYLLVDAIRAKESKKVVSQSKEAYRTLLAGEMIMNRNRILSFWNKPSRTINDSSYPAAKFMQYRHIPRYSVRTLDAPDIVADCYLNLLDWSNSNIVAIALGNAVYTWNASNGSASELVRVEEVNGPVTSVSWAPDGQKIAVGLSSSVVELWDTAAGQKLRTFRRGHRGRVGSLSWNTNILSTGATDGKIINYDVRVRSHSIKMKGHHQEVCSLKWSSSGQKLASGGIDSKLYIWDLSMASSTQWLHKFDNQEATVSALAWCPFQSNLLASGGGDGDIKFWATHTGTCLNSLNTGSHVSSLLWNKNKRELLSSHSSTENNLILWKYPSMVKISELDAHTSGVLFMAQSPDGCHVASAGSDENMKFWSIFESLDTAKPAMKAENARLFSSFMYDIR